jgi:chemotaxis protein MotB
MADSNQRPIIVIKRIEEVAGGHHGGAWKVAYADFVTAMMAFFLLLWLLGATTEKERKGIADYFAPTLSVFQSRTGSMGVMNGSSPTTDKNTDNGTAPIAVMRIAAPPTVDNQQLDAQQAEAAAQGMIEDAQRQEAAEKAGKARDGQNGAAVQVPGPAPDMGSPDLRIDSQGDSPEKTGGGAEIQRLEATGGRMMAELRRGPDLAEFAKNLAVEVVPEGVRIQITDSAGTSMFASGSDQPSPAAMKILKRVAEVAAKLDNRIAITGHTDAVPFRGVGGRTNWELSAERANAARRMLEAAGIPGSRIAQVVGAADTEPFMPGQPKAPENRRITVLLMREKPPAPPSTLGAN